MCAHECIHVCSYWYVCTSARYVHVCVCMCPHAYVCGMSVCMLVCMYVYVQMCVCVVYLCVHALVCLCVYVCMYTCILFAKGQEKSSLSQVGKTPHSSPTLSSIRAAAGRRVPGDSYLEPVNFKNSQC